MPEAQLDLCLLQRFKVKCGVNALLAGYFGFLRIASERRRLLIFTSFE
jgi:hypothetical protein